MPGGGTSQVGTWRAGSRATGVAGLGYVVLAAVENLDFQSVPALGASAADVVAYYGQDVAAVVLTAVLGLMALGCYVVFAIRLCGAITAARFGVRPKVLRTAAVVASVVGPALAAVAVGVRIWLATAVDSVTASEAVSAHELSLSLRVAGGACLGAVLLVLGLAAPHGVLPRPFRVAAALVGGWILATAPLVGVSAATAVAPVAVGYWLQFAGFVANSAWVGLAAAFLVLAPARGTAWPPWPVTLAKVLFGLVALAAGVSGVALTALPNSTASYFSWPLKPAALAALIGGCYLAASAGYGLAFAGAGPGRRWDEARGLLLAIVALSVPIAATSVAHAEAFDFAFWPAWAWFALFFAFPVAAAVTIYGGQRAKLGAAAAAAAAPTAGAAAGAAAAAGATSGADAKGVAAGSGGRRRPAGWVRGLLVAYCLAAVAGAVALWTGSTGFLPLAVGEFGAQVFASWWAFVAVVAGWTASRPAVSGSAASVVLIALPLAWAAESARRLAGWEGAAGGNGGVVAGAPGGADGTRWFLGLGLAVMLALVIAVWLASGRSRDVAGPSLQM